MDVDEGGAPIRNLKAESYVTQTSCVRWVEDDTRAQGRD